MAIGKTCTIDCGWSLWTGGDSGATVGRACRISPSPKIVEELRDASGRLAGPIAMGLASLGTVDARGRG
eukprot:4972905-Pyramimonas_sp.AAC.1